MRDYLAVCGRHHSVDAPEDRIMFRAESLDEAYAEAMSRFVRDAFPCEEWDGVDLYKAVKKARYEGLATVESDAPPSENIPLVIWCNPGVMNVGFGKSKERDAEHTDKYTNRWVTCHAWEPNANEKEALMARSHEDLVMEILKLRATR